MVTELDDGKIYRKPLYLMVKTMVSGVDFPLNQSIDMGKEHNTREGKQDVHNHQQVIERK
jgi:hypothetical protein